MLREHVHVERNANKVKHEKYIKPIYRAITWNAHRRPRFNFIPGYTEYIDRLKELNVNTISLDDKNKIEHMMLGFRIMRNELVTNIKYKFNNAWYIPARTLRNPVFSNTQGIPEKSTIARIMKLMNDYRHIIGLTLSSETQRSRLIDLFIMQTRNRI